MNYYYLVLGIIYSNNYNYIYIGFLFSLFIFSGYIEYINNNFIAIYKGHFIIQYCNSLYVYNNQYINEYYLSRINIINLNTYLKYIIIFCSLLYCGLDIYFINYNLPIIYIIILFINDFYGINIILNNLSLFYICFIKIIQDIYKIKYILKIKNNNHLKDIINLKFVLYNTIEKLEYIFILFTIYGISSLCVLALYFDEINQFNYISCIIFQVIFEGIGHIIFILINKYREDIFRDIHSVEFISTFIIKYNRENLQELINMSYDTNELNDNIILSNIEENSKSIEWLIYNEILEKNWVEFTIMGIKIHDLEFIKKVILTISIIIYIYNIIKID
tara:strand:+ start:202 stop:1200 length:999 start_codon:yes stop_codon:yes gene_type:complete